VLRQFQGCQIFFCVQNAKTGWTLSPV
jgi:hypothetical protein